MTATEAPARLSTGIDGLDEVLHGGFLPERTYMVRGEPGAGKTLIALQFLRAGVDNDESALFIALEEGPEDILANAAAVGIDVDAVEFLDLRPGADFFVDDRTYDIFAPDEAEGGSLATAITDRIDAVEPDRVVLDPATQLRYLAPDDYQFRKQLLSFVRYCREQDATLAFTSQATDSTPDDDLQFLSDGVIQLHATGEERTLSVPKFRGSAAQRGHHAVRISDSGLQVFPELLPGESRRTFESVSLSAGVPEIDQLLHGGLTKGTVTILSGPTGVGKTTLGTQFMKEAAGRGDRSVLYLFEENRSTFLQRSEAVNLPVKSMLDGEMLTVSEVEPLAQSPAEFAAGVREEVTQRGAEIVMIDGVDGYRMSLQGAQGDLTRKLHSLCRYCKNIGVSVILVDEAGAVTGEFQATSENISYLADTIVFIRYLEFAGELRKAIGVLKKRTSGFERALRAFEITEHGLKVGEPLSNLRGILEGSPDRVDLHEPLEGTEDAT